MENQHYWVQLFATGNISISLHHNVRKINTGRNTYRTDWTTWRVPISHNYYHHNYASEFFAIPISTQPATYCTGPSINYTDWPTGRFHQEICCITSRADRLHWFAKCIAEWEITAAHQGHVTQISWLLGHLYIVQLQSDLVIQTLQLLGRHCITLLHLDLVIGIARLLHIMQLSRHWRGSVLAPCSLSFLSRWQYKDA